TRQQQSHQTIPIFLEIPLPEKTKRLNLDKDKTSFPFDSLNYDCFQKTKFTPLTEQRFVEFLDRSVERLRTGFGYSDYAPGQTR
ncbi:MAG: hypothetical protein KDA84_25675, partial [Planctomycetaceae bacterium]|nr:hypothetical protein [Planctomycetaceae bacterium]